MPNSQSVILSSAPIDRITACELGSPLCYRALLRMMDEQEKQEHVSSEEASATLEAKKQGKGTVMFGLFKRFYDWAFGTAALVPPAVSPPDVAATVPATPLSPEQREARKEARRLVQLRRAIADETNHLLDLIANPDRRAYDDKAGIGDAERVLSALNTDFIHFGFGEDMPGGSKYGPDNDGAFDPEGIERELVDLHWPIDTGFVVRKEDDASPHGPAWFFFHMRTASAAELRGRIAIAPQRIILCSVAKFHDDGLWWAEDHPKGFIKDRWVSLDRGMKTERKTGSIDGSSYTLARTRSQRLQDEMNDTIKMSFSLKLTERYNWHAALGPRVGPRILLPTNPRSCLALFKDRQKGEAESRRRALRHWVGNHFRDSEKVGLSYVRDHLRGITDFDWYDLACNLMVSEFDLEKNEVFREQADAWRKNRGHNRVRVRLKRR